MNRIELLDALGTELAKIFKGYELMNMKHVLQGVRVFAQYAPQPKGATYADRAKRGMGNYSADDYESNFPCVIVRLEDMSDDEVNSRGHSRVNVKILCGVYDDAPVCQGYRDILNMQDLIRASLLENRVLARRFLLKMPLVSRLLDSDSWPVYFGEQTLIYEIGRPMPDYAFIHGNVHVKEPWPDYLRKGEN